MPAFRDNPRPSSSVDFEHSATVRDIEEITTFEKVVTTNQSLTVGVRADMSAGLCQSKGGHTEGTEL